MLAVPLLRLPPASAIALLRVSLLRVALLWVPLLGVVRGMLLGIALLGIMMRHERVASEPAWRLEVKTRQKQLILAGFLFLSEILCAVFGLSFGTYP